MRAWFEAHNDSRRVAALWSKLRRPVIVALLGSLLVALPTQLAAQPNPPRAQLVEDLRLDAEREDFARVGRVYVGPSGQIAVPVLPDLVIRLYSASGRAVDTVGRNGRGPGEFASILRVGWNGDTMWVIDSQQRRVSLFSSDGTLIKTEANPALANKPVQTSKAARSDEVAFFTATHMLADGSLAGEAFLKAPGTAARRLDRAAFVRVSATGAVRLLMHLPREDADERYYMTYAGLSNPIPFVVSPMTTISQNAEHLARVVPLQTSSAGGTVSVTLMKSTGDTVFHTVFPYRGVSIPKAVRDSAIAAELKGDGPQTEGPSNARQQFHAIAKRRTPLMYSGATFVVLGLDSTVWVGLHPTPEGQKVLVFNAKGVAVATVVLPKRSTLRQATARQIWVTETDDDGLNSVVRYRVSGVP